MKKFLLGLCLVSSLAQAEVVITGGFGTDGASGESFPLAHSVKDAQKIYYNLDIVPGPKQEKTIQLPDESAFECSRPFSGISRLNADCSLILRASQNGKVTEGRDGTTEVTFSGALATALFKALAVESVTRVGGTSKTVANITCVKLVRPGASVKCTVKNMNAIAVDLDI